MPNLTFSLPNLSNFVLNNGIKNFQLTDLVFGS